MTEHVFHKTNLISMYILLLFSYSKIKMPKMLVFILNIFPNMELQFQSECIFIFLFLFFYFNVCFDLR